MHRGRSGDGAATHAPAPVVVVVAVSRARITIISRPRAAPEKFAVDCDGGGGEIVTFRNCDDRCLFDALTAAQCSAERTELLWLRRAKKALENGSQKMLVRGSWFDRLRVRQAVRADGPDAERCSLIPACDVMFALTAAVPLLHFSVIALEVKWQ